MVGGEGVESHDERPAAELELIRGDGGRVLSVVLLGAVVASAAFLRVSLIKPLLDDVVLPKTVGDLDMDRLWPHIESIATIAGATLLVSPLAVLGRGYALVRRESDGAIVRGVADVAEGDRLSVRLASAALRALVERVEPR